MPTTVRSFSKINLGLAVGPPRPDGFHGLVTVYQTLALHDNVRVSARKATGTHITLGCNRGCVPDPKVPQTATRNAEKNTAWRIVASALKLLKIQAEVDIQIDKRLPVQGGMGAGSANAAAALLGLERELGIELATAEKLTLAAEVGSDVPLFLVGGTVLGLGRGEQVSALPDLPATHCVVAISGVGVSTAAAFRALDRRHEAPKAVAEPSSRTPEPWPLLTFQQGEDRLEQLSRVLSEVFTTSGERSGPSGIDCTAVSDTGPNMPFTAKGEGAAVDLAENRLLALVRTGVENDFEEVAFSEHPSLREIKRALLGPAQRGQVSALPDESVCLYAALSGSGSALFGLYGSHEAADAAQQRVRETGAEAILTETLPRSEYWKRMFAE